MEEEFTFQKKPKWSPASLIQTQQVLMVVAFMLIHQLSFDMWNYQQTMPTMVVEPICKMAGTSLIQVFTETIPVITEVACITSRTNKP